MRIGNDLSASQHIPAFLPQRKVSHFSITEENTGAATKLDDTMKLIEASREPQNPNSLSGDMRVKINGLGAAQSIDDGITGVADTNALKAVDSSLYQLKSLAAYGARDDISDADRALCQQEFGCLINEIDNIGRESDKHTAAVMTESSKQADDDAVKNLKQSLEKIQNRSWASMLNLKGLSIATTQDAQCASLIIESDIREVEWRLTTLHGGYTAQTGKQNNLAAEQASKTGSRDAQFRTLAMLKLEMIKKSGAIILDQLEQSPPGSPDAAAQGDNSADRAEAGGDSHP